MHRSFPNNISIPPYDIFNLIFKGDFDYYSCTDILQSRFLLFLQSTVNKFLLQLSIEKDTYVVHVAPQFIIPFIFFVRLNKPNKFLSLTDIVSFDTLSGYRRFALCYNLLSMKNNIRLLVRTRLLDDDTMKSITALYCNADWAEREVWDVHGIFFYGHPDLRRILTDYGFESHPLRKDFPLTGYKEVSYSDKQKIVIKKKVSLAQEYRLYQFNNPWRPGGRRQSHNVNS
jgi:NADH:ubiquinone oxidoreductase subunit C